MKFRFIAFLVVVLLGAADPAQVLAFGEGGCGEGACSECHSLELDEAEKLLSGLVDTVHTVDFSIVPGLWKVEVEGKGQRGSIYIDFSKSFTISGRILRLADWTDVSGGAVPSPDPIDTADVPLDDAILLGRAEARHKVIVFTDPQCPYCKKFHGEIKKIVSEHPDVAFYLKLFPLKSHPDSFRISKSIVCEKSLEMLEVSLAGGKVPDPTCETDAIDRTRALAQNVGIRSTPTVVLPDGRILSGYKPAAKLAEIILQPGQ